MRLSVVFAAALAASADAVAFEKRQRGNPDGMFACNSFWFFSPLPMVSCDLQSGPLTDVINS
jgi:hypothetical protein